jgi:hypothetical protein
MLLLLQTPQVNIVKPTTASVSVTKAAAPVSIDISKSMPSVSVTKAAAPSVEVSKSVSVAKSASTSFDLSKAGPIAINKPSIAISKPSMPSITVNKAAAPVSIDISKSMPSISMTKSAPVVTKSVEVTKAAAPVSIDISKSMPSVSVSKVVAAPAEKKGDSKADVMKSVTAMMNQKAPVSITTAAVLFWITGGLFTVGTCRYRQCCCSC